MYADLAKMTKQGGVKFKLPLTRERLCDADIDRQGLRIVHIVVAHLEFSSYARTTRI